MYANSVFSSVLFELYSEQQQILKAYQSVDRLTVHNLQEKDYIEIHAETYPKSLSITDKSVVLHVANKLNACVLSSDKTVRNFARNKNIEYLFFLPVLTDSFSIPALLPSVLFSQILSYST